MALNDTHRKAWSASGESKSVWFPGGGIATLGPEVMRSGIAQGLGCGVLGVPAMQASGSEKTQDLIQMLGS